MNALIDQLSALRLHGMAACAHDLLCARKPPSLTTAIKQLIHAETVERRVRSIPYRKQSPQTDSLYEGGPPADFAPQKVRQI